MLTQKQRVPFINKNSLKKRCSLPNFDGNLCENGRNVSDTNDTYKSRLSLPEMTSKTSLPNAVSSSVEESKSFNGTVKNITKNIPPESNLENPTSSKNDIVQKDNPPTKFFYCCGDNNSNCAFCGFDERYRCSLHFRTPICRKCLYGKYSYLLEKY